MTGQSRVPKVGRRWLLPYYAPEMYSNEANGVLGGLLNSLMSLFSNKVFSISLRCDESTVSMCRP
jgi:hypothetical protein